MKVAITGGSGFVGHHLAERLIGEGHEVVLIARRVRQLELGEKAKFVQADLASFDALVEAFSGCEAVAHCAGINREIGQQNFRAVHIEGTRRVVAAAESAGVRKLVLMSFLRARPACGSAYHESKWAAEEIVRSSSLDYTIIRSGVVYGRGDHMLDHLSHAVYTFPIFAMVGFAQKKFKPVAVEDLVSILRAALIDHRLPYQTVAVTGGEELYLEDAVRRVARVTGNKVLIFPAPVWFHQFMAWIWEATMKIPLVARAQVRILAEGVVEPALPSDQLPYDLAPRRKLSDEQIRKGLPPPGGFGLRDLRCCD